METGCFSGHATSGQVNSYWRLDYFGGGMARLFNCLFCFTVLLLHWFSSGSDACVNNSVSLYGQKQQRTWHTWSAGWCILLSIPAAYLHKAKIFGVLKTNGDMKVSDWLLNGFANKICWAKFCFVTCCSDLSQGNFFEHWRDFSSFKCLDTKSKTLLVSFDSRFRDHSLGDAVHMWRISFHMHTVWRPRATGTNSL